MQGRRAETGFPRWLLILGGLVGLGLGLYYLRGVLSPIFTAFLIAYLLDPLVDWFEARGMKRVVGIIIVLVLFLAGLGLFLVLLLPSVIHEIQLFSEEIPEKLQGVLGRIEPLLAPTGIEIPRNFDEVAAFFQSGDAEAVPATLTERVPQVLQTLGEFVWGGTSSFLAVLSSLLIVPVLAFYLLNDFDRITASIRDLIPHRYRPFVVDIAEEVDQVLGQFIRGQLLVMLILAVLYSVAYSIVGIRLAIPIGIIAGLLAFIPYVGGASALILALLMCALSFESWYQVLGVVIAYGIIQGLEGFLITPRIVGDKVGLPAVAVLIALMAGGELFGFVGVLVALPAAAVGKIFVMRAVARYRKSEIYTKGRVSEPGALVAFLEEEGLPDSDEVKERKAHAHDDPDPSEDEHEHEDVHEDGTGGDSAATPDEEEE